MDRERRTVRNLGPILVAVLVSCGGGGSPGQPDLPSDADVLPAGDLPADTLPGDAPEERIEPLSRYEILVYQSQEGCFQQLVTRAQPVGVHVTDYVRHAPATGVSVDFEITSIVDQEGSPVDEGDATLDMASVATGDTGEAGIVFRCGDTGGLTYTVTVSAPDLDAAPKTFCVTCSDVARGCLEVQVTGPNDGVVNDVQVAVLPGSQGCDASLTPRQELDSADLLAQIEVPTLNSTIRIEDLPEGTVTLSVRARWADPTGGWVPPGGPENACFSLGSCRDAINVLPNQCKTVSVSLDMWPLMPSGVYDCVDRFDFSKLIQECAGGDTSTVQCVSGVGNVGKTVCCALSELKKLFNTPGDFLFDNITDLAKQALPSILVDTLVSLFHDAVVHTLDAMIEKNAPPWVADLLEAGAGFVNSITVVELLSDLTLAKLQNDYSIKGTQYWTGLAIQWMGTRKVFSLTQLQNAQVPLNLVGGGYTALVSQHDRLTIDPHVVALNYGRLVLFVLDEVVLAGLTGGKAHSIPDAIKLWIDCKAVAQGVLGQISSWFGNNDPKVIEDACNGAIGLAAPLLPQFLDGLKLDTSLRLHGNAVLVDDDCDANGRVERITKGEWAGTVESAGAVQGDFTGTFEAVRKGFAAP